MKVQYSLLLIGCGKMGSALLSSWINEELISYAHVVDPMGQVPRHARVALHPSLDVYDGKPDMVVLAVKPQIMQKVCAQLKPMIPKTTPILSIAAGQSLANFAAYFEPERPVIRAMPNTPAAIGKGMSVAIPNNHATEAHRRIAQNLLSAAGEFLWLESESQMDAVTAVSGSGPAYVFYLMEALAKAATEAGLPEDQAMILARQTVIGSAALAERDASPPGLLRRNVTSPGGTTEAALAVLMDGRFEEIMTKAVAAATARSKELSS